MVDSASLKDNIRLRQDVTFESRACADGNHTGDDPDDVAGESSTNEEDMRVRGLGQATGYLEDPGYERELEQDDDIVR